MIKLSMLFVLVLVAVTLAKNELTYEDAKAKFGQKFADPAEDAFRRVVFKLNVDSIRANNANPKSTHKEEINQFALMTSKEFAATRLGFRNVNGGDVQLAASTPIVGAWTVTTGKDWTTVPRVITPVRNQGNCGSCWAFAAVAAIESLRYMTAGIPDSDMSEQQLVDCSKSYGNFACSGGQTWNAFNYVKTVGLYQQTSYPYTGKNGTCYTPNQGTYKISGYANISKYTEGLAAAVIVRPVTVAVDASYWKSYASGILKNCGSNLNHAVLLVGVNASMWKIKNSWGANWGQNGYIRLDATNGANTCGIALNACYPIK